MATIERLTRRPDFLAAAQGRRFHTERMTAQGRLRDAAPCDDAFARDGAAPLGLRLGLTITKRVGHAPERNRIRRRLRAAVGLVARDLPADLIALRADIVLIARRPALDADFAVLADDLRRAIPAVARPPSAERGERPARAPGRGRGRSRPAGSGPNGPERAMPRPGADDDEQGASAAPTPPNVCGGVPDGQ